MCGISFFYAQTMQATLVPLNPAPVNPLPSTGMQACWDSEKIELTFTQSDINCIRGKIMHSIVAFKA
jgi:hypothetical protein